jgi:anti-sigma regulatory factor (Ser/Thr protein kinase)
MSLDAALLGSRTVPGQPEHVADARAFVAGLLSGRRGCAEVAALLTSELVTNAVLHTRSGDGGMVTITVIDTPDGVLIKVTDDGSRGRAPAVSSDPSAVHGRGLLLVQELASQWGYCRDGARTTVWARIGDGTGEAHPATQDRKPPRGRAGSQPARPRLAGAGRAAMYAAAHTGIL